MKTLFLVRHAKAASQEPETQDIDRSLTKGGRKDARRMAKKLLKKALIPQLIISSTAKRALKTARIFANEFNYSVDTILSSNTIYEHPQESGEEALLAIIRGIDEQYQSVMIIGHDPLMSDFAKFVQKSFREKFPAGSVLALEFPIDSWSQLARGKGNIKFFDYPGRKKQLWSDMEDSLRKSIGSGLKRVLGKIDKEVAEKMDKSINKSAGKFALEFVKEYKIKQKKAGKEKPVKEKPEKKTQAKKSKVEGAGVSAKMAKPKRARAATKPASQRRAATKTKQAGKRAK